MASNLTYGDVMGTSDLPDSLRVIYSRQLQFTALPMYVFDQFAEVKTEHAIEKGSTAVWTIYRQMAPTFDALSETTDVETQQIDTFQRQMTVTEYGNAVGTTEKLNLLSFHGPISNIVRQLLAPQMALTLDTLARNAAWAGAPTRFAGAAANRAALTGADVATIDLIKQSAHALRMNRVRPAEGGGYVCVCHPSVIYDLREDPLWEDAGKYSDPARLANGEVGRLYGVRFVESDLARIANAGAQDAQTTLTGNHAFGSQVLTVASTTGLEAGMDITIYPAAASAPTGTSPREENARIKTIDSATALTLEFPTGVAHSGSDKVREGLDIFPMMFLGADNPYGKSVVQAPEVRVALPTDKLRRFNYVGWYTLLGYGTIREWTYLVVEAAASQNSGYLFGF